VGIPVLSFPPPLAVSLEEPVSTARTQPSARLFTQLPTGFRVLVMFDYLSTVERKNPLGAIDAYRRAFAPDDGAVLIVKSVNGEHRREQRAQVTRAVEGRPDIVLLDRTVSAGRRDALIDACDCYLSLHRSEGHGLPLAEAMALGKPVVATAYGGNLEFMSEANSYLVAWKPTRVGVGVEHYPAEARWAEPDVEHAARLLRKVWDDPRLACRRAAQAQSDIQAMLAPAAVGGRMRRRLEELRASRPSGRRRLAQRIKGTWYAARPS
jgi:glycosyltransferase involved in cell wall biosynthesis